MTLLSTDRQPAVAKDLPRDDQAVDLARALVDLRDARVAEVALHGIFLRVAIAPVDLKRLGGHALGHLRRVELRDRRFHRKATRALLCGVLGGGGPTRQEPRGPAGAGAARHRARWPCPPDRSGWPGSPRSVCRTPGEPERSERPPRTP